MSALVSFSVIQKSSNVTYFPGVISLLNGTCLQDFEAKLQNAYQTASISSYAQ